MQLIPTVIFATAADNAAADTDPVLKAIEELDRALTEAGWHEREWVISARTRVGHYTVLDSEGKSCFR